MYFRLYDILGIYRVSKIMIEIIQIGKFHFLLKSVAYVIAAFQSWYGTYVKYYNDQRFGRNEEWLKAAKRLKTTRLNVNKIFLYGTCVTEYTWYYDKVWNADAY